jgi:hypothetical protein
MKAEVLVPETRFEIQPEDGKPPERLVLTVRTCWRKPPVELHLELLWELDGVAYYCVRNDTQRPGPGE